MGVTNHDVLRVNQLISAQLVETSGEVFFVNNSGTGITGSIGGSNGNSGKSPLDPFSTIDYAISRCTADRGDVIYVMPGHAESHSAANAGATGAITLDVEGVKIIGLGTGSERPTLTAATLAVTLDLIEVTADSCRISNLVFAASTGNAPESMIDLADTDTVVDHCTFFCGANDEESITIPATGDRSIIRDNEFIVTANGPDSAIEIQAVVERVQILRNYFDGMSTAQAWDAGAIDSNAAHTNILVQENTFAFGIGIIFGASGTGLIVNNWGGTPYSIGGEIMISPSSGGEVQVITPDSPSGGGGGETAVTNVIYVDSVNGATGNSGGSPTDAFAGLDEAIGNTLAGEMIVILPNHSEDVTTQIDVDVDFIKIIGVGNGMGQGSPRLKNSFVAGTSATLRLDANGVEIAGIHFDTGDTANTVGNIEVVASADGNIIRDCFIEQGTNDVQGITMLGATTDNMILNNHFRVTGNGPDEAIVNEVGVQTRLTIKGNTFDGGSGTNSWDDGTIRSDQADVSMLIQDNTFAYDTGSANGALVLTTITTSMIEGNKYVGNARETSVVPRTIYASSSGSATANGDTIATAMTINAAVAAAASGVGDTILLLPGTYTLTSALPVSVAGSRVGPAVDNGTFNVTVTTASDVDLVTLTGANVEIWGIRFVGNAAQTTTPRLIDLDTGDFCRIHHCLFDCSNVASLQAIDIAATATDTLIDNNTFTGQVTAVAQIVDLGPRSRVIDNTFDLQNTAPQAWTNVGAGANAGQVFSGNKLIGDNGARATMIVPASAAADEFIVSNNMFAGTSSATPFGQNANWATQFVENYVGSNAGGVLIDPVA